MPRKKSGSVLAELYAGRGVGVRVPPPRKAEKEEKPKYAGMAMSVEDMAEELAIGRNVAYELVQDPDFPSFTIGRRVLVSRKGLQEWIDEQCRKGTESKLEEVLSKAQ